MSSVLSAWFYVLTLGISALLLVALVFIFYKPSVFLQLTSASGQLVDLTGMNNFDPSTNATVAATAQSAVITVGANSFSIADSPTSIFANAFVQPGTVGITAANDVAGAQVTGTFLFWLLMLGIGFLALILAFVAVKYPEQLFGPQVSALIRCLPKKRASSCSSSTACSAAPVKPPVVATPPQQSAAATVTNNSVSSATYSPQTMTAAQAMAALQQAAATPPAPPTPPPPPVQPVVKPVIQTQTPQSPSSAVSNTATPSLAAFGFTPQQIAMLQLIQASGKLPTT